MSDEVVAAPETQYSDPVEKAQLVIWQLGLFGGAALGVVSVLQAYGLGGFLTGAGWFGFGLSVLLGLAIAFAINFILACCRASNQISDHLEGKPKRAEREAEWKAQQAAKTAAE